LKPLLQQAYRRTVSIVLALVEQEAVHHASAMAFSLFLGLIPLAAIFGWALTRFGEPQFRQSIVESIMSMTPEPAHVLVDEQMRRLEGSTEAVAPLGVVGFLWVASGGIHTAVSAIQKADDGRERGWIHNRVLAMAFVFALVVVATGSTTVLVIASPAWRSFIEGGYVEAGWMKVVHYGALPTTLLLIVLGCAAFFRLSSRRSVTNIRRRVWPGALMTGVSWVAVSWGFSLYVRTMGRYPIFYGSLATVALLMLWLWIVSLLLLLGAELNRQVEGSRQTIAFRVPSWIHQLSGEDQPSPSVPTWIKYLHILKKTAWPNRNVATPPTAPNVTRPAGSPHDPNVNKNSKTE